MSEQIKINEKSLRQKVIPAGMRHRIKNTIKRILLWLFAHLPINNRKICFESEGDFSDNAYALYNHMRENGLLDQYEVYWFVDNPDRFNEMRLKNTIFLSKRTGPNSLKSSYHLLTSRYFIFDHCNLIDSLGKRSEQLVVNLCHAVTYKALKGTPPQDFDIFCTTSSYWAELMARHFECGAEKSRDWGFPRNDFLFEKKTDAEKAVVLNLLKALPNQTVFLWMPTFRQSVSTWLSEEYVCNETGLPMIASFEEFEEIDGYLEDLDAHLTLKVHHLQRSLPVFSRRYQNITFLWDEEIQRTGLQLYQVVKYSNCLITDYSSIYYDYLLLDNPVIFTLEDIKEYGQSRGFSTENPLSYMVGYHSYNLSEFKEAMKEVVSGKDAFKDKRELILPIMHTHADGNASSRILDGIGISKRNS